MLPSQFTDCLADELTCETEWYLSGEPRTLWRRLVVLLLLQRQMSWDFSDLALSGKPNNTCPRQRKLILLAPVYIGLVLLTCVVGLP